ncbi:conserved hypothetical protein [Ricinus communis]|uniref:Uncharacterized protein n=1 Tax=Ricinus communis TaxID=3988 RepID=B9TLS9_RICCO|nr:conserved hypothetical protein [Ricinus communis]
MKRVAFVPEGSPWPRLDSTPMRGTGSAIVGELAKRVKLISSGTGSAITNLRNDDNLNGALEWRPRPIALPQRQPLQAASLRCFGFGGHVSPNLFKGPTFK